MDLHCTYTRDQLLVAMDFMKPATVREGVKWLPEKQGQQHLRQGRLHRCPGAQRNILSNPFKRFEDMQMLHHTKTLGVVQVDESVWKKLTQEEKQEIEQICDEKLESYYSKMKQQV